MRRFLFNLSLLGMVLWSAICTFIGFAGCASVSQTYQDSAKRPPEERDAFEAGAAIGSTVGMGFLLMLWFFPTVGMGVFALVIKPSDKPQVIEVAKDKP